MPEKHPHALPSGHRIEEYEIVRVLGAGGFGITYLATDMKLDGPVALKEYFPHEHAVREADQRVAALPAEESRALFTWVSTVSWTRRGRSIGSGIRTWCGCIATSRRSARPAS